MRKFYKSCPLCESKNIKGGPSGDAKLHGAYDEDLKLDILSWSECVSCGHEFTTSYWTPEGLEILFRHTRQDQLPLGNALKGREDSARMIERLNNPWIGNWLDIGAGSGALMLTAKEYGYKVYGTELREFTLHGLREIGLEVSKTIPYMHFNVISACDVLEHIPFPKAELASWRTWHADLGTKLLISCPNRDAPMWSHLENNPYYFELEHHHNFGYKRLADLLYETGWGKIQYGISHRYLLCMELIAEAI